MSLASLVQWLLCLALILDFEKPVRQPIPRSQNVANVIATAANETNSPKEFAAYLDVLGAHESGYDTSAVGDHTGGIGRSCGAWQTPCAETPGFTSSECSWAEESPTPGCHWGWKFHPSPTIALQQARKAIQILKRAVDGCPDHPIWMYASGLCTRTKTATLYEDEVNAELAIPVVQ